MWQDTDLRRQDTSLEVKHMEGQYQNQKHSFAGATTKSKATNANNEVISETFSRSLSPIRLRSMTFSWFWSQLLSQCKTLEIYF